MCTNFESFSANVWITLIVCISLLILVCCLLIFLSIWHKKEIEAENKRENLVDKRITEKQEREDKIKEQEKKDAAANKQTLTPEERAFEKELERKQRVLNLTKEICNLAKEKDGKYSIVTIEEVFALYKKIDEHEQYEK